MKIDIIIEEEIEIGWDQGKKDVILILREATDNGVPAFEVNLHFDFDLFKKLEKEIKEFGDE